jgi:hypothetical protein
VRVTITDERGVVTSLGDFDEDMPVADFLPVEDRRVDAAEPIGADHQEVFARGQRLISFSITTSHQQESNQDTLLFLTSHHAEVPLEGTLEFTITDLSGSTRVRLTGARVSRVECLAHVGKWSRWRYSVVAPGPFETS